MIVKAKDRQISFLFQENDSLFEIGCEILQQERLEQMLPYKRKQQNGREKLVYKAPDERTVLLKDIIQELAETDIVDLLYEMVYLGKKIEENGLLKKECIWYQYDHIYYDTNNRCMMTAILPVAEEFRCTDNISWCDRFEESMRNIASRLPEKKAACIRKLSLMLKDKKFDWKEALGEIDKLGCRVSENLSGKLASEKKASLRLLYSGKEGRLEFEIDDKDFMIGRDTDAADGIITAELSKAVSRKHCLITRMNHKYFVQDLESANHTLVNGIMIPPYELMELQNNDILSVADIEFRVTYIKGRN